MNKILNPFFLLTTTRLHIGNRVLAIGLLWIACAARIESIPWDATTRFNNRCHPWTIISSYAVDQPWRDHLKMVHCTTPR